MMCLRALGKTTSISKTPNKSADIKKKMIKLIRVASNEKKIQKNKSKKSWFFEKKNKTDKPKLVRVRQTGSHDNR